MKPLKKIFAAAIAVTFIGMTTNANAQKAEWKELKEFHEVMSETFHPSQEGNFAPIKARIGEMVQKAEALKSSTIPADYNNKKVKKAVAQLVKDSKTLQAKIASGASDEEIKTSLSQLHDVFHKIVGLCSPSGDEHGHEKHDEHGEGKGHSEHHNE
jgi:hypothetical protein